VNYSHPIYIRFGKKPMQHLHARDTRFEIGKALSLSTGSEITFVATGETVACAVQARELLEREGMFCGVISMHTLKPLDSDALLDAAQHSAALITVEEHSVYGGLGEACAAVLLQHHVHPAFRIVGIPDEYTVTGSQTEILEHYGISPHRLADTARQLLRSPQFAGWRRRE
jgi:transketolase